MKNFIKFLESNNINYKIQKYGNFLYIPAEPIQGVTLSIDYYDNNKSLIDNYLKRHKKNLFFENRLNASAYYMEYFIKVFDLLEYKQFLNCANYDKKLVECFNNIYHFKGKEAAEQFYKRTMLKYNGIGA